MGRPSTTIRSRYVTRCGFGRLPDPVARGAQRGPGERDDAPLAVGPGDERAAHRELRVVQLAEERTDAAQAEADPEAPARLDRRERVGVREPGSAHSFVSSSS